MILGSYGTIFFETNRSHVAIEVLGRCGMITRSTLSQQVIMSDSDWHLIGFGILEELTKSF